MNLFRYLDNPSFDLVRTRVTYMFEPFCEWQNLSIIAMDIDRHGSLEWSAYHHYDLNRYISLFLTFVGKEGDRAPILLDFWFTVDDTTHYTRRRVGNPRRVSSYYFHSTTSQLPERLLALWQYAKAVRPEELTEAILMPIYGEWPDSARARPARA